MYTNKRGREEGEEEEREEISSKAPQSPSSLVPSGPQLLSPPPAGPSAPQLLSPSAKRQRAQEDVGLEKLKREAM